LRDTGQAEVREIGVGRGEGHRADRGERKKSSQRRETQEQADVRDTEQEKIR
jgi:hypothetical protein